MLPNKQDSRHGIACPRIRRSNGASPVPAPLEREADARYPKGDVTGSAYHHKSHPTGSQAHLLRRFLQRLGGRDAKRRDEMTGSRGGMEGKEEKRTQAGSVPRPTRVPTPCPKGRYPQSLTRVSCASQTVEGQDWERHAAPATAEVLQGLKNWWSAASVVCPWRVGRRGFSRLDSSCEDVVDVH